MIGCKLSKLIGFELYNMSEIKKEEAFDLDLAFLRREQGLSQRELADRMGITQPSLNQIENNLNDIKISSLKRYLAALKMKLTIEAKSTDDNSTTYLMKEKLKMNQSNSFFSKLEADKKDRARITAENEEKEIKKKKIDEQDLQLFTSEANKLSDFLKEKLEGSLTVRQNMETVVSDYYKSNVMTTSLSYNGINIYFQPTGPRYGRAMGEGVIEIRSNSIFFDLNRFMTISLILIAGKNNDNHWLIHRRDSISGKYNQEKLNEESLYKLLDELIF